MSWLEETIGPYPIEHTEFKALKDDPPNENSVVFEIGGYTGVVSRMAYQAFDPHLYVFEPQTWAYETLVKRFASCPKVRIFNFGLGDRDGTFTLGMRGTDYCTFMRGPTKPKDVPSTWQEAEIVNINRFLDEEGIGEIDYCMLNIEGFEYVLLPYMAATASISLCRRLGIDFHTGGPYTWLDQRTRNLEETQRILERTHRRVQAEKWQVWERL